MCDMHESDKYLLGAGIVLAPGDAVARKRWAQSSGNSYFVKKEAHVIGALQTWLESRSPLWGGFPAVWALEFSIPGQRAGEAEGGVL